MNDKIVLGVLIVFCISIFIASFSVTTKYIEISPYIEKDTTHISHIWIPIRLR